MQSFPEKEFLSDDPDLSGHLWIQEHVTGADLRFQVASSGLITFGDRDSEFGADDVPLPYRRAVRVVREELDLSALRSAVDDTESVTFFGRATLYEGVEYDWSELPAFFGVDIWSDDRGAYLPPDTVVRIYEGLGLPSLPALEKEVSAKYTDLGDYADSNLPDSELHDGSVAGVLVRDKSGGRGEAWISKVEGARDGVDETSLSPEEAVEKYVTTDRIDRTAEKVADTEGGATVDAVTQRVVEETVREEYARLYDDGEPLISEDKFRSEVAERVQLRLG